MQTQSSWGFAWLAAFLAFPIGGGVATLLIGKLETPLQGALGGAIAGLVLGLFQMLALRLRIDVNGEWIIATIIALASGVAIGVALFGTATTLEAILLRAVPTALLLGIAQALMLNRYTTLAWLWIPPILVLYPLAWFITTQVIGRNVEQGFIVFGASGAILFQVLNGLVLWWLLRRGSQ